MKKDRRILKDKRLSYKAKGIYCYLSNRPTLDGMTQEKLVNNNRDGIIAVRTGLYELIQYGYLSCHKQGDGSVRWSLI